MKLKKMKPRKFLKFIRNYIHEGRLYLWLDEEYGWVLSNERPTWDSDEEEWNFRHEEQPSDATMFWINDCIKWDGDVRDSLFSYHKPQFDKDDIAWIKIK